MTPGQNTMISCQQCGYANAPQSAYCRHCAAPLVIICPGCRQTTPAGRATCEACGESLVLRGDDSAESPADNNHGARLAALHALMPPTLAEKIRDATATTVGGRRDIAVLQVGVRGLTGITESEERYLLRDQVLQSLVEVIYEFEGHVDRMTETGVLALFGTPVMHENDPERAVRAALSMLARLQPLQQRLQAEHGSAPTLHIGVHNGSVIAGQMGQAWRMEYTVVGDTVRLAAQLEEAADADTILVSSAVHQRTRPIFRFQALPLLNRPNWTDTIPVFRPLGIRQRPGRVRGLPGLQVPLVGRQEPLAQLHRSLDKAVHSHQTQVVLLTGDAGVGKSRLLLEFRASLEQRQRAGAVYEGSCQTYTRSRPYWVVAELLRNLLGIGENEPPARQTAELTAYVETLGLEPGEVVPYLAHLLGLSKTQPAIDARLQLFDAGMLQKLTYAAVRQIILAETALTPTVLIFEDLHWVDSASWDLLLYLIQSIGDVPLLLLLVSRDDQWERLHRLTEMTAYFASPLAHIGLQRLSSVESRQLVNRLLPIDDVEADALKEQIAARAGGNPFYTEEIVRMLMDEGGLVQRDGAWRIQPQAQALLRTVPGTLQGLILARFDNLEESLRDILQKAAILGMAFPAKLIVALEAVSAETVTRRLQQLVNRQFIMQAPWGHEAGYLFQHALIQEAIYGTLLKRHRRRFHRQVAQVVEDHPDWFPDERNELLAHHYHQSGQPARAIPYLLASAENAADHYANETAVHYYRQVLDLLGRAQDDATRRQAAQAAVGLARALKLLGQYAEAGQVMATALDGLAGVPAAALMHVEALRESADILQREGDYDQAVTLLEDALAETDLADRDLAESDLADHDLAEQDLATQPLPRALYRSLIERLVFIRFRQGKLAEAQNLAQAAVERWSPEGLEDPATLASLYNHLGGISWQQGNAESAIVYVEQSLRLYQHLGYSWGLANAYSNLGVLYAQSGRWSDAVTQFEQALQLRDNIGDIPSQAISLANLGMVRLSLGDHAAARQDATKGLAIARRLGDRYQSAKLYHILAQIDHVEGHADDALKHAQIALHLADEIGSQDIAVEARWMLALSLLAFNEIVAAQDAVQQGLQLAKLAGLVDGEADCLRVLGILSTRAGDYVKAETSLREAIELFRQIHDPYRQGLSLIALGQLYEELTRTDAPDWRAKAQETYVEAVAQLGAVEAAHDLGQARQALARLEAQQTRTVELPPTPGAPRAERRAVAVLWINLSLPQEADEETIFEVMSFTLPAVATIVQEYGGMARQRPDGLMAVFGVPVTYEDDAERAVLAAHHILRHLQQPENQPELPLTVQIAVSHGVVLAGHINHGHHTELVIQGAPRQQAEQAAAVAQPNTVWVTEAVRSATEHRFVYRSTGLAPQATLPLWEMVDLREQPGPARGLSGVRTRFIGRDAPLRAMHDLAGGLRRRMGGIIWIEGEAGIGKSRLMREFRSSIAGQDGLVWSGSCAPQRANNAFSLFSDLLAQVFGLQPADTPDAIRSKIEDGIATWPADARRTRPYLEMLSGVRPGGLEGERLSRLEPEQLRHQTFVALRRLLKSLARQQPLVLLLDDLHWIDPISAELLIFIATMVTTDPILFVCAQRREGADLPNNRLVRLHSLMHGQTTHLVLNRLSPDDSQILLGELLPGARLPQTLQQLIINRSEGNPYFIEEFVRMFIEQGYVRYADGSWQVTMTPEQIEAPLPASLETLIRSRVDTLPADLKLVLQGAAIIGHEFEADLLEAIVDVPDVGLALERLASRLMLQATGDSNRWQFSHTIFAAVVYNAMLNVQRRELHLKVAQLLQSRWAESGTEHAEALAYHFSQAREYAHAIPYLLVAGDQAASRYANEEAIIYYQKAAEFLPEVAQPDVEWRWRIAIGLGNVYLFVGKYAESSAALTSGLELVTQHPEFADRRARLYRRLGEVGQKQGDYEQAKRHFSQALALLDGADELERRVELARALVGVAWLHFDQGQFDQARQACEDSLEHARAADSLNELASAENLLGGIYYRLGEWRDALQHTTRALVLREQMGYSWGVAATLSNLGILATVAGHWHKAIAFFERSLALRQEMGDVEGLTITHNNLGIAYRDQGELELAETHFRQSYETARTFNISYHIANSSIGLAHVLLWQGRLDEAQAALDTGLAQAEALRTQELMAEAYRVQAELYLRGGRIADGEEMALQSAELAGTIGHPVHAAAGWRVAADAALRRGAPTQAEAWLDRAGDALADAADDLEAGRVAAQAYHIRRYLGQTARADAALRQAREIFTRLGANRLLRELEKTTAVTP